MSELPIELTVLPATDDNELAVLELELASLPDAPTIARCLANVPDTGAWSLVRPDPARLDRAQPDALVPPAQPDAPVRVHLLLAAASQAEPRAQQPAPKPDPRAPQPTRSLGHVRDALSDCPGITRAAVLAPEAESDHTAAALLLGPDPTVLADLADRTAARLRDLPGVTLLRVHASRPRPVRELKIDRQASADLGVQVSALMSAVRLAAGPLDLGDVRGVPVLLDMPDRPGTPDQMLWALPVAARTGTIPASTVVTQVEGPPVRVPLYRIDRQSAAAVELRLRRAADREAVLAAVKDLELPPGVQLRLAREYPGP